MMSRKNYTYNSYNSNTKNPQPISVKPLYSGILEEIQAFMDYMFQSVLIPDHHQILFYLYLNNHKNRNNSIHYITFPIFK